MRACGLTFRTRSTPAFQNPNAVVNFSNPTLFGKPTSDSVEGWCCLGGQFTGILGVKIWSRIVSPYWVGCGLHADVASWRWV